jgi:hypothetical protein
MLPYLLAGVIVEKHTMLLWKNKELNGEQWKELSHILMGAEEIHVSIQFVITMSADLEIELYSLKIIYRHIKKSFKLIYLLYIFFIKVVFWIINNLSKKR